MRLPNAERAEADPAKARDYLLAPDHPDGASEARSFGALGLARDRRPLLRDTPLAVAGDGDAEPAGTGVFGRKYLVRGIVRGRTTAPRRARRSGSSCGATRCRGW